MTIVFRKARIPGSLAAVLLLAGFMTAANAEQFQRTVTILKVHPMSVQRPHCPACSGYTRIYVNSAAWGTSSCRNDAGDLALEDKHLFATLLFAWNSGKEVVLEVNSTQTPIDTVCRITAAFIS
jgi:hypothetical protein